MRICFLTQYFYPDVGAPQARLYELAVRLVALGHRVTVLTAMPFYPEGYIKDGYVGRWRVMENVDGIRVIRTWLYATKSGQTVKRMANYLSFAATAPLLGGWRLGRQDVLLVESPPLFLGPSAWVLARALHARLVFNVSDVWPETAVALGFFERDNPMVRAAYRLEAWLYRHSDLVTGTSQGILDDIQGRFPGVATALIPNGVDTTLFRPGGGDDDVRARFGLRPDQVAFVYAGLHGYAQGLEQVVEAARLLRDREDIRFVMIGDGPSREELQTLAAGYGLENIRFHGLRPKRELPGILAGMDAALIPLAVELPGAMPSKSYEAMACGLPLIVASRADIADFVAEHGVGIAVEPGDVRALAALVRCVADDAGLRRGLAAKAREVAMRFDRDVIARRAAALFESLVGQRPGPLP